MSRSNPRPPYVSDTPIHIDGKHDSVTITRDDFYAHWEGRMYPEFMLIKMGEADSYEPDWNDQISKEGE